MTFVQAVRRCLSGYVALRGRAARSEFWYFQLFVVLFTMAGALVDWAVGTHVAQPLAYLLMLLPLIAVTVRRLHDLDAAGWWILVELVPFVGMLAMFVVMAIPGTRGGNRFGADPTGRDYAPAFA